MAFNRDLSQFAAYLDLDAAGKYIGITPAESETNVGIGVTNPGSKLSVVGDANITGVVTATQFYGNLDYSYILNATAGVRTEFSVVDNGGDGSLSYDSQTGIISYVGPSASEARAHFSATSTDLGSFEYNAESGVFAYAGVTTANIRDQFSSSSADIGSLSYNSATGEFSLSGVTTSAIRDQFSSSSADIGSLSYNSATGEFSLSGVTTSAIRDQFSASSADIGSLSYNSATGEFSLSGVTTSAIRDQFTGGTGVSISNGEVSIGQPVGTSDAVTFASVNSTGIVTATEFVTGASGEAIGINTNTISGPSTLILDPSAVGDDTGLVVIKGDLQVDGTQTIINSTTVTVNDKNIQIADGAANDAAADGAGITVNSGDGNKTFQFNDATDAFKANISLDVASGEVYKIDGTQVLSSDTLGSGVVNSSLTSVGTLGQLSVSGVTTSSGGFVGNLTGDVTGNADTATALETGRDFSISGDAEAAAITFDGTANVGLALTLVNTAVTPGSYGSSSEIPTFTVDSKGRLTAAGSVSVSTGMTVAGDSGSETINLLSETLTIAGGTNLTSSAASDTVTINLDDNISLVSVSASGVVTATSGFVGDLTGNVTGDLTGEVNAAAFDTNASGVVVTGVATATSGFVGDLTGNVTGNVTGDLTGNVTGEVNAAAFDTNASGVVVTGVTTSTSGFVGDLTGNVTGDLTGNVTGNVTGDVTGNLTGEVNAAAFDTNASGVVVTGVTTSTSGFVGDLTGSVTGNVTGDLTGNVTGNVTGDLTGNVTGDLTGEVNAAAFDTNASGVVVTGVATATSGFVGNLTGNVTGDLTGNADTATALETARDFSISGDAEAATISFDGTANVGFALTLVNTAVTPGSYGSATEIPTFTVDSKGRLTAAGTAAVSTGMTVAGDTGSEVIDLLSETLTIAGGTNLTSSAASDTVTIDLDDNISLTSVVASGIVTASEFVTGASGQAIGINTNTISGPETITIDPSAVGDNTGLVVIKGDLQIDGTTTTINSTTVTVDDLNILLADGAVNDAAANGGGFTVQSGDGNKTFQFEATGDNFGSSENMNLTSGKVYKINNTEVLSSDTLGSGVVNSSLTSVGTLVNLSVGDVNSTGIITASNGFSGNLTGDVTGNVTGNLTGEVNSAAFDTNASGVVVTGVTTSTSGFVGDLTGNADTATALETARDFSISGDATASAISFDGTTNVGLALTLADTGVAAGSYGSSTEIPTFTVDSKGRLTVAGTASVGTALTVAGDSGSEVIDLLSETLTIAGGTNLTSSAASDTVTINLDDNISLVSVNASGVVTATSGFVGDLTGDVTGNLTGDVTGNLNSSGVSTVTNLVIDGYVSAGATTGQQDQVLISVGSGVTWTSITDLLPTARTGLTTTATASQTTFSFEYNVGFLDVFVNGVKLSAAEFTALNGNDIILSEGAFAGDNVEFVSYATLSAGTGEVNSLNDLTDVTLTAPSAGSLLAYDGINWIDSTNLNVGVITATAFVGDGSGLTGAGSTVADDVATDATFYPVFTNITSGTITASKVSTTKLTFNPSTGTLNATNVNTTSDINLKKDISPVENALETVQKLEGVNFTWKDNDKKTIGVIAQQIEEHLPELVDTAEHKSVNYNGLIGVLIEAVKEQQSQIEALKAEIEELKK